MCWTPARRSEVILPFVTTTCACQTRHMHLDPRAESVSKMELGFYVNALEELYRSRPNMTYLNI